MGMLMWKSQGKWLSSLLSGNQTEIGKEIKSAALHKNTYWSC